MQNLNSLAEHGALFLLASEIERCGVRTTQPGMRCSALAEEGQPRFGGNATYRVRILEQGCIRFMEEKFLVPGKACSVFPQGSR